MTRGEAINRRTLIDGSVFIVVSLACLIEGYRLYVTADPLALPQALAPGFYLLLIGTVLLVTGAFYLATSLRSPPDTASPTGATWRRVLGILGALVGYALLMSTMGYFVASTLFFIVILALFGVRRWPINLALSLVLAGVFYLIFANYLDIIFPRGLLF